MALRNIVTEGDDILTKKCREVEKFDEKLAQTIDDMIETMRASNGVGIAAPQIGLLRQICVLEPEEGLVYELVNPVILDSYGEQEGYEGCLSVPGYIGKVVRPQYLKIRAQDRTGAQITYEFRDFEAVVASHETDHLQGILYTTKATDVHIPEAEPEEEA